MRRVPGQLLQGGGDDLLDLVQQDGRRPAGPLLVMQAAKPARDEPAPPPGHVVLGGPQLRGHGLILPALGAGQHDPRPQRQHLRRLRPPRPPGQLLPLGARQHEVRLPPPWALGVREPGRPGLGEPRAPLPHGLNGKPQLSGYPGIPPGRVRARQNDPGALLQAAIPGTRQPLKLSPVLARQRQQRNRKRHNNSIEINVEVFRRGTLASPPSPASLPGAAATLTCPDTRGTIRESVTGCTHARHAAFTTRRLICARISARDAAGHDEKGGDAEGLRRLHAACLPRPARQPETVETRETHVVWLTTQRQQPDRALRGNQGTIRGHTPLGRGVWCRVRAAQRNGDHHPERWSDNPPSSVSVRLPRDIRGHVGPYSGMEARVR